VGEASDRDTPRIVTVTIVGIERKDPDSGDRSSTVRFTQLKKPVAGIRLGIDGFVFLSNCGKIANRSKTS
jgi:hypothetical protein